MTLNDYPKAYGNSNKGFFRLESLLTSKDIIEKIEADFWELISTVSFSRKRRRTYKLYSFLNAGWEWSVFSKDNKNIIKVPSEVFPEINDSRYLVNTEVSYNKILKYFSKDYVARSKFMRVDNLNTIEQEFIRGKDNNIIGFNTKNLELLNNIKEFLKYALKMLSEEQWLPDFNIQRLNHGFQFNNVIIESKTFIPKIIDFTSYYDVYRLYPMRTKEEIEFKSKQVNDFIDWIEERKMFLNK
jgi:hypothetical protein